jgi:hypothetical protein
VSPDGSRVLWLCPVNRRVNAATVALHWAAALDDAS